MKKQLILSIITLILGIAGAVSSYFITIKAVKFILAIVGSILILLATYSLWKVYAEKTGKIKKLCVKEMTFISIMSAISILLYYFAKFNLPFFPSWLDVQVSELPALITSFMYGPVAGCIVILVRFIIKLPATSTMGVGELSDLILGLVLVIFAGVVYKKKHNIKGALIGGIGGCLLATLIACFTNWLILIPFYMNAFHFTYEGLASMMSYVTFINITADNFMLWYILIGVIPFNLFRYVIVLLVTFALYKRLSFLMKGKPEVKKDEQTEGTSSK